MKQEKKKIYNHLLEYQQRFGGYTGKDLDETARIFGLNKRTLKRVEVRRIDFVDVCNREHTE
jgi:ActR/RegA family two-component response regulator